MDRQEALDIVRGWNIAPKKREVLEALIPELAESEDERIRRWLIEQLNRLHEEASIEGDWDNFKNTEEAIAWLVRKEREHIPWYDYNKSKEAGYTIVPNEEYEELTKPAGWSEEDIDKMVNERARKSGTTKTEMNFYRQGIEDTLKSLRPQQKTEWKEEDKEKVKYALIKTYATDTATYLAKKIFSNTICPQPHWKPTEEDKDNMQLLLNDLTGVIKLTQYHKDSLINWLKKLLKLK